MALPFIVKPYIRFLSIYQTPLIPLILLAFAIFDILALFLALCGIPLLFLFFPTYSTLSIAPGGGETLLAP